MSNKLQLMIRTPSNLEADLKMLGNESTDDCIIAVQSISAGQDGDNAKLKFGIESDPNYVWMAFQFLGAGAVSVLTGIVSSYIYSKIKEDPSHNELVIRFSNGSLVSIKGDVPITEEIISEIISNASK